jgi:hypothetical protein
MAVGYEILTLTKEDIKRVLEGLRIRYARRTIKNVFGRQWKILTGKELTEEEIKTLLEKDEKLREDSWKFAMNVYGFYLRGDRKELPPEIKKIYEEILKEEGLEHLKYEIKFSQIILGGDELYGGLVI